MISVRYESAITFFAKKQSPGRVSKTRILARIRQGEEARAGLCQYPRAYRCRRTQNPKSNRLFVDGFESPDITAQSLAPNAMLRERGITLAILDEQETVIKGCAARRSRD